LDHIARFGIMGNVIDQFSQFRLAPDFGRRARKICVSATVMGRVFICGIYVIDAQPSRGVLF
jgi:hypothetical protein